MTLTPLVTAVVPTFNRVKEVCRAVDSILAQTYSNTEIIVVDDGSTDGTWECLTRYGNRIRVIRQTNSGPSAARNNGIRSSNGEIIAFLDSDDIWLPGKIERQVSILGRAGNSIPCCLSNAIFRLTSGREIESFNRAHLHPLYTEGVWDNVAEVLLSRFVLFNQAVAIRKEALTRAGGFDESLWYLEDHDLALRLAALGPWAYTAEPLVVWLEGASGSLYKKSANDRVALEGAWVKVHEGLLNRLRENDAPRSLSRAAKRAVERGVRKLGLARRSKSSTSARMMLAAASKADKYRMAFYRRTPWFPKMRVRELAREAFSTTEVAITANIS